MLDLIEMTNQQVLYLISFAFALGILFGVILFMVPVQTRLDSLRRHILYAESFVHPETGTLYRDIKMVNIGKL